jgi:hypothetical protein
MNHHPRTLSQEQLDEIISKLAGEITTAVQNAGGNPVDIMYILMGLTGYMLVLSTAGLENVQFNTSFYLSALQTEVNELLELARDALPPEGTTVQ